MEDEKAQQWYELACKIRRVFRKYNQTINVLHRGFGVSDSIIQKHRKLYSGIDNLKYNLDECIFIDYYIDNKLRNVEVNGRTIDPRDFFYSDIIEVEQYQIKNEYPKRPFIKKIFIEDKEFILSYIRETIEIITSLINNPLIEKHPKYYKRIQTIVGKLQKNINTYKEAIEELPTV
jgi:hypothetical protein